MINSALCKTTQHVKGRLCPGSLQAFRVAFLLPAERWAAVNKAESVLKEQPLYQATSQHRVSVRLSLDGKRIVSVSTPDKNGKWDCQPVAWYVTAWKKMTQNQWKIFKKKVEVNKCPSLKWFARIYSAKDIFALWFVLWSALFGNELKLDALTSLLPLSPLFSIFTINHCWQKCNWLCRKMIDRVSHQAEMPNISWFHPGSLMCLDCWLVKHAIFYAI